MSTETHSVVAGSSKPRFISGRLKRGDPHFVRNVFLSAIVTGLLVGFGTYVVSNTAEIFQSKPPIFLADTIGRKSISLDAMKQIVHKNNLVVYWLGGTKDSVFSLDYMNPKEPILANMVLKQLASYGE